ncbi:MAG: hypothetical protein IMW89_10495 [Ktedonobacteraceae bacterium]|nr:hypothetical protein [Ktedonobacteraceae bacterium]
MEKQTRRGFIKQTSLSTVLLATVPALATAACATGPVAADSAGSGVAAQSVQLTPAELSGLLIVYVRNVETGEIGLLAGSREIVYRDTEFVKRLLNAAR